jgi:hypothetical protein
MLKIPLVRAMYVADVREMISEALSYEDVDAMYANVLLGKRIRSVTTLVPLEIQEQVLLTDWPDKILAVANAMYEEDMLIVSDTIHDMKLS